MADNKTKGGFKPAAPVLRMPTADVTAAADAPKLVTLPQEPQIEPVNAAKLPQSVTLASHYGYIADDGSHRFWVEGRVETDPALIAELIERRAPLKA